MPIIIEELMIEAEQAEPSAQGTPDAAPVPPSLADRVVDARAAADRRLRLLVD